MSTSRKDIPAGYEGHTVETLAARLGITKAEAGRRYCFGEIRAQFSLPDCHVFNTAELEAFRVKLGTNRNDTPAAPGGSIRREFSARFRLKLSRAA